MKMINKPPSNVPYIDRHRAVVDSKKNIIKGQPNKTKQNLINLDKDIALRYLDFEQAIQNNQLFSFIQNKSLLTYKDDLLSCYTGRTNKVEEIFNLIKTAQTPRFLKRCPYCGMTLPKTYDHYLPETKFPELAVHALNLIPCCSTCNQIKNNNWKNSHHRTFIYFYSDLIPSEQFLNIRLYFLVPSNSVGAIFSLQRPTNVADNEWNIINSHYEKLNLINNYNENVNDEITEVFNTCVSHLREGGRNIGNFIFQLISTEENLYGINHWRVVLMKALARSPRFERIVINAV
ncbi:HNH endonuclease [Acinetobacter baumannii]|uniref:HNH endonuclease n=1 Tax=Acinetobacter calcoaceticus/baumannii complex TaxID=909768 RepID=UPI0013D77057|nr:MULTISPECIES: HNH endonuclease [Acinetobacter calcoaceticus/baumannii complex]MDH2540483.1 HNH endonuclease [Acinetobacter baumannii]